MDPDAVFGVWDGELVSWVGRGMGVLDGGGYRRRTRDSLNLGRPIVTNGDVVVLWIKR